MATFATAELACHAAGVMHARIEGLPSVAGGKLAIRVGFHYGSVLVDGVDVFGNTVNVASRITEVAKAREIITSAETAALLPEVVRKNSVKALPAIAVKGVSVPLDLVEVSWNTSPTARLAQTTSPSLAAASAAASAIAKIDPPVESPKTKLTPRVILRYGKQEILMRGHSACVTLGRDTGNDIVIHDPRASRNHGTIELRDGKCILTDKSSNGTFVSPHGENNVAVNKEELVLTGKGYICFGHICPQDSVGSLAYEVQPGTAEPAPKKSKSKA
jgi:adenylate cyclase